MSPVSGLGARLALAATSIVLTLVLVEGGLRVAGYAPESFAHTNRIANRGRAVLLDCYPTNPRGYFDVDLRDPATLDRYRALGLARLDEAARVTPFAVERRFNSRQFRSAEIGPHRPSVLRVAVIGDSFTEGMGVKEEDAYPRVLHRLLNTGSDTGRWEVLNCGRRGYDFPALFDLFETVLALEPDVVIYGMVLNDAADACSARTTSPACRPGARAWWPSCATAWAAYGSGATPPSGTATCTASPTARAGSAPRATCAR